jgi:hypothetical protein
MQDTYAQDLNKNLSLVAKYGSEDLKAMLSRVDEWPIFFEQISLFVPRCLALLLLALWHGRT